ncbi:MAG: hypothetical protein IKR47_03890 [Lachnospiraceae bacterium]|nr:hypothetical protein [Lachnospiraceae bacterium]
MIDMNKINDEELEGVNGGTGRGIGKRLVARAEGAGYGGTEGAVFDGGTDTETPAEEKMTWCDTCHTQVRYREFSGGRRKGVCGHWV